MLPEERDQTKALILHAVEGQLSLDELYSAWPDEAEGDSLAEAIFDDVESAVEHYPLDHGAVVVHGSVACRIFIAEGQGESAGTVPGNLDRGD